MREWKGQLFVVIFLLLSFVFPLIIEVYTDWLWFLSTAHAQVFLKILSTRAAIALAFGAGIFLLSLLNVQLASRSTPEVEFYEGEGGVQAPTGAIVSGLLILSFFAGLVASAGWKTVLRFFNAVPFGIADPVFSKDVGFYVFTLPFYEYLWSGAFYGLLLVILVTAIAYSLKGRALLIEEDGSEFSLNVPRFTSFARAHLSLLGALLMLVVASGYRLGMYRLLYSKRSDVFFGAGYTDLHIQLPVLKLLIALSLFAAVLFILNIKLKDITLPLVGVALLVLVSVVGGGMYPNLIQQYRVSPNEISLETPYIERNIEYTTKAYGLENIDERLFAANLNLSAFDLERNNETIENIRLWDHRPLKQTYGQMQEIRLYYTFNDVDVDRYHIDGIYRQVMLSPRELSQRQLPSEARTWVNEHLVYTHGYGVVVSPVNRVTEEGLPELLIKDIPPKSSIATKVTRPEVYYGEEANDYVVVNTKEPEFDYPKGDKNEYANYAGSGGVVLDSALKKLAMTLRFRSAKLFLTDSITPQSRLMMYRNIHDRVRTIAPFLEYDEDPYVAVSDGKLYWIQDAYTTTDRYPYSQPYGRLNYIRNSVKVVVDAYNGDVSYYVVDAEDPLLKTYVKIFPELFKPVSEMPEGLLEHIRYPVDLFRIQAAMYSTYHMRDPKVFYNKEDLWNIPNEVYEENQQEMEPYYMIMRLPGEEEEEFILMLPFTPNNKDNMIAWMAAKCDQPDYGELVLYKFPKEELIYGPMQIEARIDQNAEISQQLTLWSQEGSRVIRGNTLVIPIEESVLYVEPLYLLAERSELPELKRVIVGYGTRIFMEATLEKALRRVFEAELEVGRADETRVKTQQELVEEALAHYEKAKELMQEGDWAGYGRELELMGEKLNRLKEG